MTLFKVYMKLRSIAAALSEILICNSENLELNRKIRADMKSSPDDYIMFTSKEAADFVHVGLKCLYNNRQSGHLKAEKIKGRWWYSKSELIRFRDKK